MEENDENKEIQERIARQQELWNSLKRFGEASVSAEEQAEHSKSDGDEPGNVCERDMDF